jgi:hypothetical protein
VNLASAQTYSSVKATPAQEVKANKIVLQFDDELSLTEKQELLFQTKQAEFIAVNESILNSQRTRKEINGMLLALYQEQANEMKEILTQPQYDVYKKVRNKIDPLIVILK